VKSVAELKLGLTEGFGNRFGREEPRDTLGFLEIQRREALEEFRSELSRGHRGAVLPVQTQLLSMTTEACSEGSRS
jgi:hypothetical protein